jgi:ABC-type transport system involved in cytochrome bd biosynthesis fused ATPase/permease subunit
LHRLIVHRLHLLPRFDTVILMEHGRIIDRGKPAEVKSRQPRIFAHWTSQVRAEMPDAESRVPTRRPVAEGAA